MMDDEPHIVGALADSERYQGLNPLFPKAFSFLRRLDIATLPPGRYEIDGDRCWASIQDVTLTPFEGRKLEAHRRFIDIQAPLTGPETIGLARLDAADQLPPFDEGKDFVLYEGKSEPVTLKPGEFAIFFPPQGAHAPCGRVVGGPATIRKAVVKVAAF